MATGDVRPVEATEEEEPPLQASTPLQGPTAVPGPMNLQDTEAPRLNVEAPGSGTAIRKRMNIFKIMNLKLM
jgi:hypothetical protein